MKLSRFLIALFSCLIFLPTSCKKGKKNPDACNGSNTRREIKLAIDQYANQIDTTPITIGVKAIGELSVPEASKKMTRQSVEKKVYKITALVEKVSKHWDGDIKVKLTADDKYINCEFPNPGCEYAKNSAFYPQMSKTRAWVEKNRDNLEGRTITITGIAFIDLNHKYPRKNSENELELHPVLNAHF